MRAVWWLFGNPETRQAIAVKDPSFSEIQRLKGDGFELVWDSAPSAAKAYEYGETYGDGKDHFFRHACRGCGFYRAVSRYVGQHYRDYYERWVIFNGRLCDMCAVDRDSFKVKAS